MRRRTSLAAVLLASVLGASGCVVVPIPTPPIAFDEITPETLGGLKPGETTRVDVLMSLGDPTRRLQADRIFVYDWSESHWIVLIGVPGGGGMTDFGDTHRLAIEFSESGRIARLQQFARYSKEALEEDFDTWVKRAAEGAPK